MFFSGDANSQEMPWFIGRMKDLTVEVGQDAEFTCTIKNMGRYRVISNLLIRTVDILYVLWPSLDG